MDRFILKIHILPCERTKLATAYATIDKQGHDIAVLQLVAVFQNAVDLRHRKGLNIDFAFFHSLQNLG
ncbi:hypothetical protein VCSRO131_3241 [Vibrio cholerae]|nr:hypothetical protein VCSRO131_3241 [Vibrio cholerae]